MKKLVIKKSPDSVQVEQIKVSNKPTGAIMTKKILDYLKGAPVPGTEKEDKEEEKAS